MGGDCRHAVLNRHGAQCGGTIIEGGFPDFVRVLHKVQIAQQGAVLKRGRADFHHAVGDFGVHEMSATVERVRADTRHARLDFNRHVVVIVVTARVRERPRVSVRKVRHVAVSGVDDVADAPAPRKRAVLKGQIARNHGVRNARATVERVRAHDFYAVGNRQLREGFATLERVGGDFADTVLNRHGARRAATAFERVFPDGVRVLHESQIAQQGTVLERRRADVPDAFGAVRFDKMSATVERVRADTRHGRGDCHLYVVVVIVAPGVPRRPRVSVGIVRHGTLANNAGVADAPAPRKRAVLQRRARRNPQRRQLGTAVERVNADGFQAFREPQFREGRTALERVGGDSRHALPNLHGARRAATALERVLPDTARVDDKVQIAQLGAVLERRRADGFHAVRDFGVHERAATVERMRPDTRHARHDFNRHLVVVVVATGVPRRPRVTVREIGHGSCSREGHMLDVAAPRKRAVIQRRARRERHVLQRRAVERVRADGRHGVRDDNLLELRASFEGVLPDGGYGDSLDFLRNDGFRNARVAGRYHARRADMDASALHAVVYVRNRGGGRRPDAQQKQNRAHQDAAHFPFHCLRLLTFLPYFGEYPSKFAVFIVA